MNAPPIDLVAFLDEPGRPAAVATVGSRGGPALGSLWYAFDERRFWFTTRDGPNPFLRAAHLGQPVAVMVEMFQPPTRILLARVTGPARIESGDPRRVQAIYQRYLGTDVAAWPAFFRARLHDPAFVLWSVLAERGTVQTNPSFVADEFRWRAPGTFLDRSGQTRAPRCDVPVHGDVSTSPEV